MFERLRKLFRRTKVETLPLQFEIDEIEDGHHVVKVYKQANEDWELVRDIRSLWRYGYREEEETDDGTRVYALSEDDRQTLLSLKSLNPDIRDDGALVFKVSPPILRYLRTKPQITEGERSRRLRVSDEPLRPTAKVEFDRRTGLTVQVGYALDDSGDIIPEDQLHKTADGGYARIGNTFVRLPDKLSDKARELLQRPTHQVPLSDIPEFFTRDLVLIKKDFNAVLTDLANLILVLDEPLKPVVRVDRGEQGWLDFRVEYQAGALRIPHDLLSQKAGQKYCQVNATTWSEKFDWVIDKIAEIHQQGEQVVVFSHFLGMLDLLEAAVQQQAIRYIRMDGRTRHRQPLIDRFNRGEARVALCSIMVTGHGINLQSANHVIHSDRWWNPAIEDQATDRVHRIGQDRTVYVYRVLTEGTLEERIDRLLEEKRGMADRIIGAATTGPAGGKRRGNPCDCPRTLRSRCPGPTGLAVVDPRPARRRHLRPLAARAVDRLGLAAPQPHHHR